MKSERVFVFDTNAFVSAHLISGSVNDKALRKVLVRATNSLLALHPFRTIPIVTASTFLEMF